MRKLSMRIHYPVSTAVEAIGYNRDARALAVRYHNGGEYLYVGVHPHKFTALRKAPSAGAFINKSIAPKYKEFRMEAPVRWVSLPTIPGPTRMVRR